MFLSEAGVASRGGGEELIRAGRVRINGNVVTELGVKVDPDADQIEVDGRAVAAAAPIWIALHKPPGYVVSRHDPQGRPTIYELIPAAYSGLFHVGRLDIESEGIILLTTEGDAAHRLLHPSYEMDRVYDVGVRGRLTDDEIEQLLAGVELEDGPARAVAVQRRPSPGPRADRLLVTMREGRKRVVRRIFRAIGHPVLRLVRRRFGPIELGGLKPAAWRRLSHREVTALRRGWRRMGR
jgi:23S rRNA pseudouridine2605 synthase